MLPPDDLLSACGPLVPGGVKYEYCAHECLVTHNSFEVLMSDDGFSDDGSSVPLQRFCAVVGAGEAKSPRKRVLNLQFSKKVDAYHYC